MSVMLVLNLTTTTLLSVHTSSRGHTLLYVVDDMMITGDDSMFIDFVKKHVSDKFLMSDLAPLGLKVSSTPNGIFFLS